MVEPLLTNDRGRREWAWLLRRVGEDRARQALAAAVRRGRKPFPLNAARELGLSFPPESALPVLRSERSDEIARDALSDIRQMLGR